MGGEQTDLTRSRSSLSYTWDMDNSDGNTEVVITTAHTAPLTGITGIAHLRPGLPSGAGKAVVEAVSSAGESRE